MFLGIQIYPSLNNIKVIFAISGVLSKIIAHGKDEENMTQSEEGKKTVDQNWPRC